MTRTFVRSAALLLLALPLGAQGKTETAVLAGGCFWGVDAVFKHVKGVTSVVSGYAGGAASTADYQTVSDGQSGHAESVKISYDPSVVTYGTLLKLFFSVAHDPTQLNRQGPDTGPQYRSAIFFANAEQQRAAQAMIAELERSTVYKHPIVTQVVPLQAFYAAEPYHQDYLARHPTQAYIVYNDLPKVEQLRTKYPELYRETAAR